MTDTATETRVYYFVMSLVRWEQFHMTQPGGCVGFLPVFESREAAAAWRGASDAAIISVQEATT